MNFLLRIKAELFDPKARQCRGLHPSKTGVETRDLIKLVDHFESLDADIRAIALDKRTDCDNQKLDNLIRQMWHRNGKDSDEILFTFSDTIKKLIDEERRKKPRFKGLF